MQGAVTEVRNPGPEPLFVSVIMVAPDRQICLIERTRVDPGHHRTFHLGVSHRLQIDSKETE